MAASTPLRTAVLGFGVSGRVFHAPLLHTDPSYSLDFVVTGDAERAARARARFPGVRVVADADALFRRADEVDLVVIGTPPSTHVELATAALDAGLHVVVDKPFAPSSAAALRLVEHAGRTGQVLTVYQNRRWDADFLTVSRLLRDGELGEVHVFESRFETWKPSGPRAWKATTPIAEGGGVLFDLGSHLIDQAIRLFGPVEHVWADIAHRAPGCDADDDTLVVLGHRDGTRSRLTMSSLAAIPGPRFHVLGSRGAYRKWGSDGQEPALRGGMLPDDPRYGWEPREHWGVLGIADDTRAVEPCRGRYDEFYRTLAEAIRAGHAPPVDPRDAVDVVRVIERAHGL